jgi:hypothetical protein
MSVYIVAQLRFTDRAAYDRYQARFPAVFAKSRGRLLGADETPEEGRRHACRAGARPVARDAARRGQHRAGRALKR